MSAEAERLIREAHRRAPDNAAITNSLGWALYLKGKLPEAIALLERAAQGEPADVEINEHLGDAYFAAGRRVEARFAWTAALALCRRRGRRAGSRPRSRPGRAALAARRAVIHEIAYAKINLALHVRERLPDGYHRIETIFAFCEDGDVLIGRESDRLTLDITGPFARELAAEPDNLVLRAARHARRARRLLARQEIAARLGARRRLGRRGGGAAADRADAGPR